MILPWKIHALSFFVYAWNLWLFWLNLSKIHQRNWLPSLCLLNTRRSTTYDHHNVISISSINSIFDCSLHTKKPWNAWFSSIIIKIFEDFSSLQISKCLLLHQKQWCYNRLSMLHHQHLCSLYFIVLRFLVSLFKFLLFSLQFFIREGRRKGFKRGRYVMVAEEEPRKKRKKEILR